jgi:hypothetical protein
LSRPTYIVFRLPIAKLRCEDLDQLATPPSLLAVGVVSVIIWLDATKSIFQIVRHAQRIAGGYKNIRGLFNGLGGGNLIDIHESHCGFWREFELSLP